MHGWKKYYVQDIISKTRGHLRRVTIQYVARYMRVSYVNICVFVYMKKNNNSGRAHTAGKVTPMAHNDLDLYNNIYILS